MPWAQIPFRGTVNSRSKTAMGFGEWARLSGVRLRPGDAVQLHLERGRLEIKDYTTTKDILCLAILSFENSTDKILAITEDGTSTYLETADVPNGSFTSIQTITGVATACAVVHRGDQYFVGTDQGNYVIQDNVSRSMGMDGRTGAQFYNLLPQNETGGDFQQFDHVVHIITEYDSTNDLESAPQGSSEYYFTTASNTHRTRLQLSVAGYTSLTNSNADSLRIYRTYVGNNGDNAARQTTLRDEALAIGAGIQDRTMGLLETLDVSGGIPTNYDEKVDFGRLDPPVPYPLVNVNALEGGGVYEMLVKPANFTLGVLFNDSLVVNDPATSNQILRYSPPGGPEYQPAPYFMYFATERSDEIVGLHVINSKLVVLLTGSVHRVNYLPFAGFVAQERGRQQESITKRQGCVGRHASTKVEGEQGEVVVWLSRLGLRATNGFGWTNPCRDFDIEGAGITETDLVNAILVNSPRDERVELYIKKGTVSRRWDFYYGISHIQEGGQFKMVHYNDHDGLLVDTAVGVYNGIDRVWSCSEEKVWLEGEGVITDDVVWETGYFQPLVGSNPFSEGTVHRVGLAHDAMDVNATATLTPYAKMDDALEETGHIVKFTDLSKEEVSRADSLNRGERLRFDVTISGSTGGAMGPIWMEVDGDDKPNG